MVKKYVRIQERELSPTTGKPRGIFATGWRMIYDEIFSDLEAEQFKKIDKWFKENLPEPDIYKDNNSIGAITYFKTESTEHMLDKLRPICDLFDKYNRAYDIVYTDYVGTIVYEDEYQVATIEDVYI